MLDNLYENIGIKIKEWAQGIFIAETVVAVIAAIALFINKYFLAGILTFVLGPYIAWGSSWLFYAFGQLVDDIHAMRNQASDAITKKQTNHEAEEKSGAKITRNDTSTHKWRCSRCGNMRTQTPCEHCGNANNTNTVQNTEQQMFVVQNDTLIKYNGNDVHVTIPENVTMLKGQAFLNNKRIVSVILSENITTVGEWAFYNCKNLEKIHIPNSVINIGENAFFGCDKLSICAQMGSYAQKYAEEYNIPFVAV